MTLRDSAVAADQAVVGGLEPVLRQYLLALADDEFLLGHRNSEWTGLGPILEEDIAFSSMAQDELGHARLWYELAGALGADSPDALTFLREAPDWRNARLLELPRGDYATSLVRQYAFDLAELLRLDGLCRSTWRPLAEAAAKVRQEEKYHLIHGESYLRHLGHAGGESRTRLEQAAAVQMPLALGLWEPVEGEGALVAAGIVPDSASLAEPWLRLARERLEHAGLAVALDDLSEARAAGLGGRAGSHGPELAALLATMQALYRSEPGAVW